MSTVQKKTTFRRGRSHRGQKHNYQSRRGRGNRQYRRNNQRNYTYKKRTKENINILTKQDFFNVGLLVLDRQFEQNGLEDTVKNNPDVLVLQKRGVIVDTRREFKRKMGKKGISEHKSNSRNRKIGSALDNLRNGEELPQWYELEDDEEEFGEEMLMGGFDKRGGGGGGSIEGGVEDMFKKWKTEEVKEEIEKEEEQKIDNTMIVMESLLHVSSDEENEEWGQGKLEESKLNIVLDKEFTLETLAGQTEVLDKTINRPKIEEVVYDKENEEDEDEEINDLKSLSLLGKIIDDKETFFDDLDKKIEQSFMIAKKEDMEEENDNLRNMLDDSWKPDFKNDFDLPLNDEILGNMKNDESMNMEEMLQQVEDDYEDVFAGFESNMNKILYGGSFMDDSMMSINEDTTTDSGIENRDHSLFKMDENILDGEINQDLKEETEKEEDLVTKDEEKKETQTKKELTPEEKEKRKQMFLAKYGHLILMCDEIARETLMWHKRNKKKMNPKNLPVNKITDSSVQKYTSNRYKIFTMLFQGSLFYPSWFYKDLEGKKHGPFMAFDMDIWNTEGVLKEDFLISPNDKTYLRYDKFNDRDNSIFDLMYDVMMEQQRILKMNEMKMKEEKKKRKEKRRGRGRGRGRGRRDRKDRYYKQKDYYNDSRYNNYDRDRERDRDRGEFYFKKKNYRDRDYDKQNKFEPKNNDLFKKKSKAEKIDEEEFPSLGMEKKMSKKTQIMEYEEVTNDVIPNTSSTPKKDPDRSKWKKKGKNEIQEVEEIGFTNADDIPEIEKKEVESVPVKVEKKKEESSMISRWDMEVKVVKKQGKKKRRKKRNGRKVKPEERNEEMTDNIKKMFNI